MFVGLDLVRPRFVYFLGVGHTKVVLGIDDPGVEFRVCLERVRHCLVLEDRFPRALGLTDAAIDAFFGIDEKLIGKLDLIISLIEADMGTWQSGLKQVIKVMKDDNKEGI